MRRPKIIDATLREGNQAPGVKFTEDDSVRIAKLLDSVGVDMIEIGHPLAGPTEHDRTRAVANLGLDTEILAHARAHADDIQAVARAGAGWVGIFLGVNDITTKARVIGRGFQELVVMVRGAIRMAKDSGLRIRYSCEDSSRTPEEFLREVFSAATDEGADRICFADTIGRMEPVEVADKVAMMRAWFPDKEIEVHLHDDRGLALASSLAAYDAGADWISTSVNGLGERCGITDLSALLVNFGFRGLQELPNLKALKTLSSVVAEASGRTVNFGQPIVGRDAFRHGSKLHVRATSYEPRAYDWIKDYVYHHGADGNASQSVGREIDKMAGNAKSEAWELIGDQFWRIGRVSARPSEAEIKLFLEGVDAGTRVTIIGASTKFLIESAIDRGAVVTVLDFSRRMCSDLRDALHGSACDIRLCDVTRDIPNTLVAGSDLVLSDRLINRFDRSEASVACANMARLAGTGLVRASIKLGLYEMDERLIEHGKTEGNLDSFYDSAEKTFWFERAGPVLERALCPHGTIDRNILLEWYRRRGRETRFEYETVVAILASPKAQANGPLRLRRHLPFPDAPRTAMFEFSVD